MSLKGALKRNRWRICSNHWILVLLMHGPFFRSWIWTAIVTSMSLNLWTAAYVIEGQPNAWMWLAWRSKYAKREMNSQKCQEHKNGYSKSLKPRRRPFWFDKKIYKPVSHLHKIPSSRRKPTLTSPWRTGKKCRTWDERSCHWSRWHQMTRWLDTFLTKKLRQRGMRMLRTQLQWKKDSKGRVGVQKR